MMYKLIFLLLNLLKYSQFIIIMLYLEMLGMLIRNANYYYTIHKFSNSISLDPVLSTKGVAIPHYNYNEQKEKLHRGYKQATHFIIIIIFRILILNN